MKKNENLLSLVVPHNEILEKLEDKDISSVKIINRKKTENEIKREENLKSYVNFFQREVKKVKNFGEKQNYNVVEIANDQFMTVTDYLDRDSIQSGGARINFQINTLDGLMRLLENPIQLKKVDLIHAVMPFEDAASLIYPLACVPQVSECETTVMFGAYGNLDDVEELDYNIRVINAMSNKLDFIMYEEEVHNRVYTKMIYSTYKKNMRMKH